MEIKLEPDLSHCIQTLAKKEYGRIMNNLLASNTDDEDLGERLEMLKTFLETTDFNKLRSEYEPYLIEGKQVIFTLYTHENTIKYRMEIQ